jgi:hypothetical protein
MGKKQRRRMRGPFESLATASAAIHQLRRELDQLRESLAETVETQRVVVRDPAGLPRVVINATTSAGSIGVLSRNEGGVVCAAELFGQDAGRGEPAYSALTLVDQGDVAAVLDVESGRRPDLWIRDSPLASAPTRPRRRPP